MVRRLNLYILFFLLVFLFYSPLTKTVLAQSCTPWSDSGNFTKDPLYFYEPCGYVDQNACIASSNSCQINKNATITILHPFDNGCNLSTNKRLYNGAGCCTDPLALGKDYCESRSVGGAGFYGFRCCFRPPPPTPTPTPPPPCIQGGGQCVPFPYVCGLGNVRSNLSCGELGVCCVSGPTPTPTPCPGCIPTPGACAQFQQCNSTGTAWVPITNVCAPTPTS